jgi:hypothetical protein
MGNSLIQPSFTGGELSPSLYGRVDLARYGTSLKTCRNFVVQLYGGVSNRAGTKYLAEVKDSTKRHRLIPFAFSTTQTYVLEFGHLTMRVYKDGGQVVYSSGGSAGLPVEIVTPYSESDLPLLNFTQSADVLYMCHPSYKPRQISRTAHDAWTIAEFANINGPFQTVNSTTSTTVYTSAATGTVTLTASSSIFSSANIGQLFYIEQKDFGQPWETNKSVSVGNIRRSDGKYYEAQNAATTGTLRPTHDSDNWSDGAVDWKFLHPGFGVCRITAVASGTSATATVVRRLPDASVGSGGATYKWAVEAWGGNQGYPSCVAFHQQRLCFANTPAQPQSVWMSRTNAYIDFGTSTPIADDDAVTFTLASRQVNAIRHMLTLDKLVLLTSGGEWIVAGGENETISPSSLIIKQQGYRGSSTVPPQVIGNTALYLQDKGQTVRDLGYEFASDTYTGTDLTVLASHLVEGRQIKEWAYQQVPFSCTWAVRSDGVLLGMTYMREQQVIGWHRHDTDGEVESVCVISEQNEDGVYLAIKRTINGSTKRFVERMQTRVINDIKDAFFVDCGLTYDGRNTGTRTMTLTSSGAWTYGSAATFTLTANTSYFVVGDVGSEIHFTDNTGRILRLLITAYTSGTVVTVTINRDVATELRSTALTAWGHARKNFAGLSYLEGKTLSVLADGHVAPQEVVASGAIALSTAATVVHAGLPIEADFETLDLSAPSGETVRDKQKIVHAVRMILEESRGLYAGRDENSLVEYKQRSSENYDDSITLLTGIADIIIQANWNKNGRVFVRQSDPLPLSILAAIPEVTVGGA